MEDIKKLDLLLHMYQDLSARITRVEKDLEALYAEKLEADKDDNSEFVDVGSSLVERRRVKNEVQYDYSHHNKSSEILDNHLPQETIVKKNKAAATELEIPSSTAAVHNKDELRNVHELRSTTISCSATKNSDENNCTMDKQNILDAHVDKSKSEMDKLPLHLEMAVKDMHMAIDRFCKAAAAYTISHSSDEND